MAEHATPSRIDTLQIGELPCLRLATRAGEAVVALQGAQVLSWKPAGQAEVIWQSEKAVFARGQPVRGGIPVCWPWFGDFSRNPDAVKAMMQPGADTPAHGLVRGIDWKLVDTSTAGGAACATLRLDLGDGLPGWPHACRLELRIRLDERLALTLATSNLGKRPMVLSQALHTYIAVGDSRRILVTGLEGLDYLDTADGWRRKRQEGPVRIEGETDRIYLGASDAMRIDDQEGKRVVRVEPSRSHSAVVWNPWVDKSRRLSQFAQDAWQRMVCIETARVCDDVLVIEPGQTGEMAVALSVEPAAA